jgi:hypothetical protein
MADELLATAQAGCKAAHACRGSPARPARPARLACLLAFLVRVEQATLPHFFRRVAAEVVHLHLAAHVVSVEVPGAHMLMHAVQRLEGLEQVAPHVQSLPRGSGGQRGRQGGREARRQAGIRAGRQTGANI